MPKLKTKSSTKLRFSLTAKGKVRAKAAGKRHFMRRRPQKTIRSTRSTMILAPQDARIVKSYMPNA